MANHRADAAGTAKSTNGRPDGKENAAAAAGPPTMVQVVRNRLADLMGQRKIVAYSSLCTHVQRRGTPVNVVEFEKGDVAQAQSQPCKQQQNAVVATPRGGSAIDAGQESMNSVNRNRTRNGIHQPVRDDRNNGGHIRHSLVMTVQVVQKGAKRGGTTFACFFIPRRRVLHESHDIVGARSREEHLTCAEAMLKEGANKRNVAQYRCRGQGRAPRPDIARRPTTLGLGLSTCRYRCGGNHRLEAQVVDEVP